MNLFALVFCGALVFAGQAYAESLKDCKLYVRGERVQEVEAFDINNYTSETPEATIDGNLLDYSKTDKSVTMSFSNECDNMYEITFSNAALAKAKSGEYKTLIGKATVGTSDLDNPFRGILKCTVAN